MKKPQNLDAIVAAIEPIVTAGGYDLIEVVWGTPFNRRTLTVFVDKPGGILVDECRSLSRQIGDLLEERDLVKGSYVLEVSSPGAERPLKDLKDYERFAGRYALICTREPLPETGRDQVYGYLRGLTDSAVKLEIAEDRIIHIPLNQISKARLAIKF